MMCYVFKMFLFCVLVEQVKGHLDVRQKIIAAARELRKSKDYPVELLNQDCPYVLDKYTDTTIRAVTSPYPNLDRQYSPIST